MRVKTSATDNLYYLLSDHLGGTSKTINESGTVYSELRYSAWGETRYSSLTDATLPANQRNDTPTDRRYTGQLEAEAGLYFYQSRFYDPALSRWTQPDSVVPSIYKPQDWNRYTYTENNSLKYIDPDGHNPVLVIIALVAVALIVTSDANMNGVYAREQVNQVVANSPTSADVLINLFSSDKIPGETAQERFDSVLDATSSTFTGLYFGTNTDDSGFKEEFKDPYPSSRNQVGHFLTGANLANKLGNIPIGNEFALNSIIGHELYPDDRPGSTYLQIGMGYKAGNNAQSLFLGGTDDGFRQILSLGQQGTGNSGQDLRLSYQSWMFGLGIRNREIRTRNEAARWLEKHLKE